MAKGIWHSGTSRRAAPRIVRCILWDANAAAILANSARQHLPVRTRNCWARPRQVLSTTYRTRTITTTSNAATATARRWATASAGAPAPRCRRRRSRAWSVCCARSIHWCRSASRNQRRHRAGSAHGARANGDAGASRPAVESLLRLRHSRCRRGRAQDARQGRRRHHPQSRDAAVPPVQRLRERFRGDHLAAIRAVADDHAGAQLRAAERWIGRAAGRAGLCVSVRPERSRHRGRSVRIGARRTARRDVCADDRRAPAQRMAVADSASSDGQDRTPRSRDYLLVTAAHIEAAHNDGYDLRTIQGYIYQPCNPEPACIPPAAEPIYRACKSADTDCAIFLESERAVFEANGYIGAYPAAPRRNLAMRIPRPIATATDCRTVSNTRLAQVRRRIGLRRRRNRGCRRIPAGGHRHQRSVRRRHQRTLLPREQHLRGWLRWVLTPACYPRTPRASTRESDPIQTNSSEKPISHQPSRHPNVKTRKLFAHIA